MALHASWPAPAPRRGRRCPAEAPILTGQRYPTGRIRQEDAMGFLDELLGGALGQASGQPGGHRGSAPPPASAGGGMSSIMMALLPVVLSMLSNRSSGAGQ